LSKTVATPPGCDPQSSKGDLRLGLTNPECPLRGIQGKAQALEEDTVGDNMEDDKKVLKDTKITLGKYIIHKEKGLELIAIDAPNKGIQIGFTNSIINSSGGTHVNGSLHALTGNILGDKKSSTKESLTIR